MPSPTKSYATRDERDYGSVSAVRRNRHKDKVVHASGAIDAKQARKEKTEARRTASQIEQSYLDTQWTKLPVHKRVAVILLVKDQLGYELTHDAWDSLLDDGSDDELTLVLGDKTSLTLWHGTNFLQLQRLLTLMPHLQKLKLNQCTHISPGTLAQLQGMKLSQLTHVELVNMRINQDDADTLHQIAPNLSSDNFLLSEDPNLEVSQEVSYQVNSRTPLLSRTDPTIQVVQARERARGDRTCCTIQ